ncbi:Enoyl-CoA hydratase domain-containing protein 3, mitochondrial [Chionoecetes opilio]|uniref:Enoyl-CoA hydratase domain-containing protein 3, mitochondrial n=1 Tax=Chionoecetes opilio TaxID=41210 RepID=A0A8J4XNT3_CHIOP|nr:Enoyl-CoA hydratase domain-containing protein 3, mitochondrial [Chionoecetes opilio]
MRCHVRSQRERQVDEAACVSTVAVVKGLSGSCDAKIGAHHTTASSLVRPVMTSRLSSLSSGRNSLLEVTQENGVRSITLADPRTRNSLSLQMLQELQEAVSEEDPSLRCITLQAQGKVFSAGHNLKELTDREGRSHHQRVFEECTRLMLSLQRLPVPVVAKVNGVAAAAGCQLVASCDVVVASLASSFSTPGANVGIFCSTPGIPLVRCVPRKVSAHMLLTGLPITAEEALRAGLVSKVVPEEELDGEVQKVIDAIVHKSRSVIALGKKFMYKQMEMGIEEAYRMHEGAKRPVKDSE